jgi:hypothetical protein
MANLVPTSEISFVRAGEGDFMNRCPTCDSTLPERAIFCPICTKQARCKACRDYLEPNARACVSCGTLVGEGAANPANEKPSPSDAAINILHFQEDKGGRALNFRFTDAAMATVGETLVYALDNRLTPRDVRSPHRGAPHVGHLPLLTPVAAIETVGDGAALPAEHQSEPKPTAATDASGQLREIFHQEGTILHLDEPRLKADSKLDYARRLAFLFIFAHEQEGRTQVLRGDLNTILQKVYDANTATFLRNHSGFERDGEMFRLNKQGRDEAKAALTRIYDTAVEGPGWMPDGRGRASKDDADSRSAVKTTGKRGRKPSTKPKEWTQKWKASHDSIDAHSLLEKRTNTEKGIFALWAVSKVAGDDGKVVSERLLSKFLLESLVFQIEERALARALLAVTARGKVLKVEGGFQLQPPGAKWAQDLATGKSV